MTVIEKAPRPALVPAMITARITIWIWGAYAIWQGAWIVDGGIDRWGSPSFSVLRLAPNPTDLWGSVLIGLGLLIIASSLLRLFWVKTVGLIGLAIWSLCFAFGALAATYGNPKMASTGGPTYVAIAAAVLVLVFVDERLLKPTQSGVPPHAPEAVPNEDPHGHIVRPQVRDDDDDDSGR